MIERKIPVASIQIAAHDLRDVEARMPHLVERIAWAASQGAKLIVVPEGSVPAYVIGTAPLDERLTTRALAHIGAVAREYGTTIVYGTAHRDGAELYNTGTVIGPDGQLLGRAEKQLLWHFDQRWFARGRTLEPIDTPVGRLGVLICADGRLPTLARTLVDRGAQILVVPTAWVTSGRDPSALENVQADVMVNVRARENGVPLIAANKVGVECASVAYCGKSAILDASGNFLARAGERDETILQASVAVSSPSPRTTRELQAAALPASLRTQARIAITNVRASSELLALAEIGAISDVDLLIAATAPGESAALPFLACDAARDGYVAAGGVFAAVAGDDVLLDPGGLVTARLSGVDVFVWQSDLEECWRIAFARTRAAELRAYVVALPLHGAGRAFAVDPDGVVVCGTFDSFVLAAFNYAKARAAATEVAPNTDVLAGLRDVELMRARVPV